MSLFDPDLLLFVVGVLAVLAVLKRAFNRLANRIPSLAARGLRFPGALSVLVAGLLAMALLTAFFFIPTYFSHQNPECEFLRAMRSERPEDLLLLTLAAVIAAWLVARYHQEIWAYEGFGTKLFVSEPEPRRPRIGTKWLVAVHIPILPVRSYEVLSAREVSWDRTEYGTESLASIDWDHVRLTLRRSWWIYGLVLLVIVAFSLFSVLPCRGGWQPRETAL